MLSSVPHYKEESLNASPVAVGLPTSFEDFVHQEQERLQREQNDATVSGKDASKSSQQKVRKKARLSYSSKAASALAEAVAMTKANKASTVAKSEPTEAEVTAAMPADAPTGNSKEDRKKRRLIRNRVSAQLHRERKKKYIASLEEKVRDQCQQIGRMNLIIQNLGAENRRLVDMATQNLCPSCASSGSDSSLPYSPLSESPEDDMEPADILKPEVLDMEPANILKPEVLEEEVVGDINTYADKLLTDVDLDDSDEFEFGMWGEDVLKAETNIVSPKSNGGEGTKRKLAMLFGVFFMTALFGSSLMTGSHSSRLLMLDQHVVDSVALSAQESASMASVPLHHRRRRSLLSLSHSTNDLAEDIRADSKSLSLWKDIMHDTVPLKKGAFTSSPEDVKNLICAIENISAPVEQTKSAEIPLLKKRFRSRENKNLVDTKKLVHYNVANDINYHGLNRGSSSIPANASFLLCPKPYGSMAQQSENEHGAKNVLMYDNIKVNRDVVLFMPSSSVDVKNPSSSWDGKWVQVNAVIESIRTAPGLSGMKAIASSS